MTFTLVFALAVVILVREPKRHWWRPTQTEKR